MVGPQHATYTTHYIGIGKAGESASIVLQLSSKLYNSLQSLTMLLPESINSAIRIPESYNYLKEGIHIA